MSKLIRVTHFLRALDFRVFIDFDIDELQNRETFNSRTKTTIEKINELI